MWEIVWLTIGIWLILMISGWGLPHLNSTKNWSEQIWLAPWWGVCLIVLGSGVMSLANIPMRYARIAE